MKNYEDGYTLEELYKLYLNFCDDPKRVSRLADFACCDRKEAAEMIEAFQEGKLPETDPRLRKIDAEAQKTQGHSRKRKRKILCKP